MAIQIECHGCDNIYHVPDHFDQHRVQCPRCKRFQIAGRESGEPSEADAVLKRCSICRFEVPATALSQWQPPVCLNCQRRLDGENAFGSRFPFEWVYLWFLALVMIGAAGCAYYFATHPSA